VSLNTEVMQGLKEKAKKIRLLMLDVDGVLTDGRIIYDSRGRDMKFFDVHDGLGVYLLYQCGIKTILITAKGSRTIKPRARDMRVAEVFQDIKPKSSALAGICNKYKVKAEEICFMGDDLVDLCLMDRVGLSVAVFNACPEIKQSASYITVRSGGRGAVREIAELILKAQGRWEEVIKSYDV
jgi:3-deoxy-D-manno-octulosonate 8-phosphate phosphatase (KDO 8-P phosphatase)